uniref:Uncharacterized protein n=1 Tax=Chromera velia CCMP2878 TaxID=1169474 RepID=A0A0G4I2Z7_9ALVE|eukprot:Cvel_10467.t1-p1 / transcript=Cvel_10467.t1 / gene=Cvel_10467 / organism=Chromera_velia_CCMP2878 / gene_product=hypothetical protein / transcript_product=hypothetical protein / location=Cvel_scaffold631:8740-12538(-) / protein_length=499 / sequence_SO=supercontig / SO=protein_coding / is_pseudo=false
MASGDGDHIHAFLLKAGLSEGQAKKAKTELGKQGFDDVNRVAHMTVADVCEINLPMQVEENLVFYLKRIKAAPNFSEVYPKPPPKESPASGQKRKKTAAAGGGAAGRGKSSSSSKPIERAGAEEVKRARVEGPRHPLDTLIQSHAGASSSSSAAPLSETLRAVTEEFDLAALRDGRLLLQGASAVRLENLARAEIEKTGGGFAEVNRSPVMILWAAVVAERVGIVSGCGGGEKDGDGGQGEGGKRGPLWGCCLSLATAAASYYAQAKGESLKILQPAPPSTPGSHDGAVELLGQMVPTRKVKVTGGGGGELVRGVTSRGTSADPVAKDRLLQSKFDPSFLPLAYLCLRALADSVPVSELKRGKLAYELYTSFRPGIPKGAEGWGAAGRFELSAVFDCLQRRLKSSGTDGAGAGASSASASASSAAAIRLESPGVMQNACVEQPEPGPPGDWKGEPTRAAVEVKGWDHQGCSKEEERGNVSSSGAGEAPDPIQGGGFLPE